MIIIGEKLNGSIPSVGKAIAERNAKRIRSLAIKQEDAEADFLDVCASVPEDVEVETLKWMLDLVQDASDLPICLDSPSPNTIVQAIPLVKKPGLINSVSMEGEKIAKIFPVIADTRWKCIALCSDENGIPDTSAKRLKVFERILAEADKYGIAHNRLFIDPLVEMLAISEDGVNTVLETIRGIRAMDEDVHIIGAVSNISFNLPARALMNQIFTALAIGAGMDAAILDPLNRDMIGAVFAAEACMGLDEYCMEYIGAFREGRIGPLPKE
ncbi:MAG: dihydropteroate synthase [Lachnospiraceae bacterium]|nr:dihydropteroate synthase [Lachnospiraceae bacterium]